LFVNKGQKMNILNNNTFRIITACILGVIGTLVVQEVTSETELLVDTTVATGITDAPDTVNVVDDVNNEDASNDNNVTENSGTELNTVTTPNITGVDKGTNNK
jgi:division protein CdvB (Snf7/Vps24/ESCRT-III family)